MQIHQKDNKRVGRKRRIHPWIWTWNLKSNLNPIGKDRFPTTIFQGARNFNFGGLRELEKSESQLTSRDLFATFVPFLTELFGDYYRQQSNIAVEVRPWIYLYMYHVIQNNVVKLM